jgi:hypothetical protein
MAHHVREPSEAEQTGAQREEAGDDDPLNHRRRSAGMDLNEWKGHVHGIEIEAAHKCSEGDRQGSPPGRRF